jgi:hypothetical protein
VNFGGMNYTVAQSGITTITTDDGKLEIQSNGEYTTPQGIEMYMSIEMVLIPLQRLLNGKTMQRLV